MHKNSLQEVEFFFCVTAESNVADLEDEFKEECPEQKSQTTSWWSYLHPYYYFA